MREVINLRGGLTTLRWSTRFIYTVFLAFCAVSYGVMVALALHRSGVALDGIATYYRGDEAQMIYGKTRGEMLEVTHFHMFAMPLMLFVQGHLFLLTTWPRRVKVAFVVAGAVGIALDLAAPWLIVYVTPTAAILENIGRICMGAAFTAFAVVPLYEMWLRKRPSDEDLFPPDALQP